MRVAGNDRPVTGADHGERARIVVAHGERLAGDLGRQPVVPIGVLQPVVRGAESLDEQILVVAKAVRHAPGDVLIVAEVRHAGNAREGITVAAKRRTINVDLVVDVGGVQASMRVAGDQWQTGGRAFARHHPGVATAVGLTQPVEFRCCRREFVEAVQFVTAVGLPGRHRYKPVVGIAPE